MSDWLDRRFLAKRAMRAGRAQCAAERRHLPIRHDHVYETFYPGRGMRTQLVAHVTCARCAESLQSTVLRESWHASPPEGGGPG